MIIDFRSSFKKDLKKIKDQSILDNIKDAIKQIDSVTDFREINHLKKISGSESFYRIRIGDYRIGILLEHDQVILVRCLHRKDMYKYFP